MTCMGIDQDRLQTKDAIVSFSHHDENDEMTARMRRGSLCWSLAIKNLESAKQNECRLDGELGHNHSSVGMRVVVSRGVFLSTREFPNSKY